MSDSVNYKRADWWHLKPGEQAKFVESHRYTVEVADKQGLNMIASKRLLQIIDRLTRELEVANELCVKHVLERDSQRQDIGELRAELEAAKEMKEAGNV